MVSSPVYQRETVNKGKITAKEAYKSNACMVSASVESFGPEFNIRKAALTSAERKQWQRAMQEEYNSLLENQTREVVDRRADPKILTG